MAELTREERLEVLVLAPDELEDVIAALRSDAAAILHELWQESQIPGERIVVLVHAHDRLLALAARLADAPAISEDRAP